MKPQLVRGHTLRDEGRLFAMGSYFGGIGRARCSCGETSEHLPSTAARKRWHREHKAAVAV